LQGEDLIEAIDEDTAGLDPYGVDRTTLLPGAGVVTKDASAIDGRSLRRLYDLQQPCLEGAFAELIAATGTS